MEFKKWEKQFKVIPTWTVVIPIVLSIFALGVSLLGYNQSLRRAELFDRPYFKIGFLENQETNKSFELKSIDEETVEVSVRMAIENFGALPGKQGKIEEITVSFPLYKAVDGFHAGNIAHEDIEPGSSIIYPNDVQHSGMSLRFNVENNENSLKILNESDLTITMRLNYSALGNKKDGRNYWVDAIAILSNNGESTMKYLDAN